jgi:hypothetical protein
MLTKDNCAHICWHFLNLLVSSSNAVFLMHQAMDAAGLAKDKGHKTVFFSSSSKQTA